jgi:hypothetical protein
MPIEGYDSVAKMLEDRVEVNLLTNEKVRDLFVSYMDDNTMNGKVNDVQFYLRHTDAEVRNRMASLLHPRYSISDKWKERYGIETTPDKDLYQSDVESTLTYFELHKILFLQGRIMEMINTEKDPLMLQVYQEKFLIMREQEKEILKRHKTVVFKSQKYKG